MIYQDKECICRDCGGKFIFSSQEQKDFDERGFRAPNRCRECHKNRTSRRNYSRGGESQTHTAPCSVCGKEAELPFKPSDNKPVYCTQCFQGQLYANTNNGKKEFVLRKPEKPKQTLETVGDESTSFADFKLDERLERAVREAGYDVPTPVQLAAIPLGPVSYTHLTLPTTPYV